MNITHFGISRAFAIVFGILLIGAFGVFLFASQYVHDAQADGPTIFSDGFESGNFSVWSPVDEPWAVSTVSEYSGEYRAGASGDTDGDSSLAKEVSTEGYEELTLSYWYSIINSNNLEEDDHVYVEWYDGEEWHELAHYTDMSTDGWTEESYELPGDAEDNEDFKFRFRADLSSGSDEFRLDDVELTGYKVISGY
jgi:hypothetical protein